MKIFVDTNVLVAAMVQEHENHERAFGIVDRIQKGKEEGFASGHSLAEVYAVLTKAPPPFRHTPEQALLSIEENIVRQFKLTALNGAEYAALIREAALAGIQGGTIYDAVLLKCAVKVAADKIFTLNEKHFRAIAPKDLAERISVP